MRWLAAVVLVGCWNSSSAPPVAPQPIAETGGTWRPSHPVDRCATIVPHIYATVRADPSSSRFPSGMIDELQTATLDLCHETAWSEESLDCYEKASTLNDATTGCYRLMSEPQREAFELKFNEILQRYQNNGYRPPVQP